MLVIPVVCTKLPYAQEHVLQDMHVMIVLAYISYQYQPITSFRNARENAKLEEIRTFQHIAIIEITVYL